VLVEQWLAGARLRISYDLDAGDFSTPGDWTFFVHRLGTTYRADLGSGATRLYLGGTATWRDNGASWAAAGYRAFGVFVNMETQPRDGLAWRAGYRLDVRRFPDYAELDQAEHGLFTSLLVNLPTRTTLIGEVRVGRKSYDGLLDVAPIAIDPVDSPAAGEQGRGRGPGGLAALDRAPRMHVAMTTGAGAGQVSWLGRVAQSLADRTGVSLQYFQREIFGSLPSVMVVTPALFFDDGVYDDPFASEQRTASGSIKQVFTRGDTLKGWGAWSRKAYTATPAYGLDGDPLAGDPLREDRIWRTGLSWTHPFLPDQTGPVAVDLLVNYTYTRHESNDLFYNYRSHVVGLGAAIGF